MSRFYLIGLIAAALALSAFAEPVMKPVIRRQAKTPPAASAPAAPAPQTAQSSEPKSYTTSWAESGIGYRSVMFPHVIKGCKVMIQSREDLQRGRETLYEISGPDCNCDLVIDGKESLFLPPSEYAAAKMLDVCKGPAVDGADRRFEIMRESLKLKPDFSKMENVQGFRAGGG